jgi:Zn-dependent peptidase ImmA (M78 family)
VRFAFSGRYVVRRLLAIAVVADDVHVQYTCIHEYTHASFSPTSVCNSRLLCTWRFVMCCRIANRDP